MTSNKNKPLIIQHYSETQINNGGPATGALLLINSFLNSKYDFIAMDKSYPFHGYIFKQFFYFYNIIKTKKPDLIHIRGIHSEGFFGVLAAKLLGVKVVMSVHGVYSDVLKKNSLKYFLFRYVLEPFALKKSNLVYCVCEYACNREFIMKYTKNNLYGYIYNAAPNINQFKNYAKSILIREKYNIKEDEIIVTLVSRVTIDKGFEDLSKAIKDIINLNLKIKFIICGDGDYLESFKLDNKQFVNSGDLICLGKISNVIQILNLSDIFLFPSLHENLSNALLEAASLGLAIIATNVGGNPEIIQDGISGILINPNSPYEIITSVKELASNYELRKRLGEKAKEATQLKFNQENIFNQISIMYDKLIESK